jgi:LysM domain
MEKQRLVVCLFTLALLLGVVSTPLAAQEDTYVVQKGDNLWKLAGKHLDSESLWEQIYRDNPFLQETGRRFQKEGIVYVMIRPGEKLVGLEKIGIMAEMTPIDKLQLTQPAPVVYKVPTTPTWVWWPLGLALLLLIVAYLVYRMLTRDPATARPPIVRGGVDPETADSRFQQMAARQHERSTGVTLPTQQFVVLRQTIGRIWGVMSVRYADGRSVPRQLRGERAYQALVRFPNGKEETLYMLQACGNDLRYGGISRYLPGPDFRFEADPAPVVAEPLPVVASVEPAPAPEPTPAPVVEPVVTSSTPTPVLAEAATAPLPAQAAAVAAVADDGTVTFEFRRQSNGQPSMVRLKGIETEEFTFEIGPAGTTLRYREAAAAIGKN